MPKGAGDDYVNAAICIKSRLSAPNLLAHLHDVEKEFDRERSGRWISRTLDLDLIDHGGLVVPSRAVHDRWRALPFERQRREAPKELILPHPRVQDRGFVLVPLAEIAPKWRHPILGQTTLEMLEALPHEELAEIEAVAGT